MTEQIVESVISAEEDAEHYRKLVPKGRLGEETSVVPSEPISVSWRIHGQGHLVGENRKTLVERLNEAYSDEMEPEEREFLELAKESYRRQLIAEE